MMLLIVTSPGNGPPPNSSPRVPNRALAMAGSAVAIVTLHAAAGTYAVAYLTEYYLPYALLLSFGEAFITGMSMALMVAYFPQWVLMFDDKRYLARR
jgi:uncharacterized membrane protein